MIKDMKEEFKLKNIKKDTNWKVLLGDCQAECKHFNTKKDDKWELWVLHVKLDFSPFSQDSF